MKSYIWTLPTRIFHWMLVLYVTLAFLSSEWEWLLDFHAAVGYGIAVLLLFRLMWGFMGPRYSRFVDWPLSKRETLEFLRGFLHPKREYAGHNPAASWVMLGILLLTLFTVLSGVITYGVQEGKGVFAWLNGTLFRKMKLFEELHELSSTLLLFLIAAHLGGVVMDTLLHKESGTMRSIMTGYKRIEATPAALNFVQKLLAAILLSAAVVLPLYTLFFDTPLTQSRFSPVEFEKEHALFVEECASCHTLYPPQLLPKRSWKKLMANLADHFGDDASLDEEERSSIERYLLANSAESSTKEAVHYISLSIGEKKKNIIAISDSPYWIEKHASIDKATFKLPEVKSKANCKACHQHFEKGLIEDHLIAMPKGS